MVGLGGKDGVAAPIVVAGQLWGALGAALPETDGHGAFAAADRIRRAIERTPAEPGLAVTVSAGVCSSENAHDVDTLVRNADRALYRAKESGRNATFLYTDEAGATLIDQFAAVRQRGSPD